MGLGHVEVDNHHEEVKVGLALDVEMPPPPDLWAKKFPLMLIGGLVEGLACAYRVARTPVGVSGNFAT